ERARGADDAVAGQHDRDAIAVHYRPDRACRARMADTECELSVRRRLPVRHTNELVEHREGEGRQGAEVEGDVEVSAATLEVFVDLAAGEIDASRRANTPGSAHA